MSTQRSQTGSPVHAFQMLDGGTGEELFRQGVEQDRSIWSAVAVVNPQYHTQLQKVHQSFIEAGCTIITVNSFALTPGVGFEMNDILKHGSTAVDLALAARNQNLHKNEKQSEQIQIAFSLPPLVESYRPDLVMSDEREGTEIYKSIAGNVSSRVDLFLAETLSSIKEMRMAFQAVQDFNKPIYCSWTLGSDGNLRSGEDVSLAVKELLQWDERFGILKGVLFNCCEPESIDKAFQRLIEDGAAGILHERGCRLGASPNTLEPVDPNWTFSESDGPQGFRDDLNTEVLCDWMVKWRKKLGSIFLPGGCCGIKPEDLKAIRAKLVQADI